jgi:hypothetical protein
MAPFPTLETMVAYGIYTVRDLVLYTQGKLHKRHVVPLNECRRCAFVFPGTSCNNCGLDDQAKHGL